MDKIEAYKNALARSTEYFGGDENSAKVFLDKYALQNREDVLVEETPDDMHHRLAREFAKYEANYTDGMGEDEIYNLFKGFEYVIPQGSPMSAIGNPYSIQSASNCFVIPSPQDSYGGIFLADQREAQIMKRRGGVGFDISEIRPKGISTSNAAKTTDGIAVFMDRFSNTCREVAQGGRRGALMLTIDVTHPEIETFINIKRDKKRVTGANISIRLTDAFMNAVKSDSEYIQQWPVKSDNPSIKRSVKAKTVWNQIINAAWESAEPGLLFWDNAVKNTPSDIYTKHGFGSTSTNPCQPAHATVLTRKGIRTIGQISIGDEIWSETGWTVVVNKWSTGVKPVYEYKTSAGEFVGTENHRLVSNGVKIEARHCESIDTLVGPTDYNAIIDVNDVIDGLVIGDGSVHGASNDLVYLCIGGNDESYFKSEVSELIIKHRPGIKDYAYEVNTRISAHELPLTYNRVVPERYIQGSAGTMCGFLRGLYSANGSICGGRVTLKTTSIKLLTQVQVMLSALGIKSYYTTNKSSSTRFLNGDYVCRESYDLNITSDRTKFYNMIGFIQPYKNELLLDVIDSTGVSVKKSKVNYDVRSVELISEEEVFDITVDNATHTYWTGGLNVSNCGEIVLSPNDSCRLMVLNLYSFVQNKFESNSEFDFAKFESITYKTQHLMDSMIDIEIGQIDKILSKIENDPEDESIKRIERELWQDIRAAALKGRRTGLGITGLGDALAALGMRYGSPESIEMTERIYKTLAVGAYKATIDMAEVRGAFEVFNYDLEKNHEFLLRVIGQLGPEYILKWKKFGRRNIALTTTAPTGSVSMLTQTTSGIEPAFMTSYVRRKKITDKNLDAKVSLIDANGDKFTEFSVFHHGFKKWMDVTGSTEADVEKSPYHKATSNDVDWLASVEIQAVAQKWICHSISKTCNLPNSATKELVADVYMAAWQSGCKGFTVYRDGCRDGILIGSSDAKEVADFKAELGSEGLAELGFEDHNAPKRPNSLDVEVNHVRIGGEQWTIFVGLYNGRPYEVFGGIAENIQIPKKIKHGKVVKTGKINGRGIYTFTHGEGEDKIVVKDIVTAFANSDYAFHTLAVSGMLRHGTPVKFILDILGKTSEESDLYSFNKVLSRVLKHHIKDGQTTGEVCPSCGAKMIFIEGCKSCTCGYSKC